MNDETYTLPFLSPTNAPPQKGIVKPIPFAGGHYGGPANTASALLTANRIPEGFYWGEDTYLDDAKNLRARPSYALLGTSATGTSIISCFKLGSVYHIVTSTGTIQQDSAGWANIAGVSSTGTSKIYVDFISLAGSASPLAIVSRGDSESNIIAVSAGTGSTLTPAKALGLAAQDENRLFCFNSGYFYFSLRGDYNSGYNTEWFSLGPSCYPAIGLLQVAGTLYVIKQCSSASTLLVYKKVSTNSDPEELLDLSYFSSPFAIQDGVIPNGMDGIATLGGSIYAWLKGQGLLVLNEKGAQAIGDAMLAEEKANSDYEAIVAPATNFRTMLIKHSGKTTSYAVNVADGRVHGVWNVNVTCKGYGEAGGMFGISNQKSPCILSAFPTSTSDTSIVPKVYTAASHFGYPDNEKFLTKVFIDGRGVTSLKIYRRMGLGENFTLDQTITNPKQVTNLPGTCRFGDLYLLIEGNPLFLIRTLGVEFNVGGLIYE